LDRALDFQPWARRNGGEQAWSAAVANVRYNEEITLAAPAGVDAITVNVEIDPPTASCTIYGYRKGPVFQPIQIVGSASNLVLPFCDPKIYVAHGPTLRSVRITTVGHR